MAFDHATSLEALKALKDSDVAVMGVEIVNIADGRLRYRMESWSSSNLEERNSRTYVQQSQEGARTFIEDAAAFVDANSFFVFELSLLVS